MKVPIYEETKHAITRHARIKQIESFVLALGIIASILAILAILAMNNP